MEEGDDCPNECHTQDEFILLNEVGELGEDTDMRVPEDSGYGEFLQIKDPGD